MKKAFLYTFISALILAACSPQSNTPTSKAFHNTTAHFNGYWYANEDVKKIEKNNLKAHLDDYNEVLLLYPPIDSARAKGYDKEIQEAIKMASLAIQRHPGSRWEDDAYVLVGKARLLSLDWANAIQTFKYVNTKSKNRDTRHEAILQLARTFTEHNEFNNAVAAFDFLEKEPLNKENQKNFYLQRAHYYQKRKNYDYMVRNLILASPLLKKADRRGRIYFIIGQVYQKLALEAEAYRYYKKTVSTNPEYEIDFYARLYMAQVAEISRSKDLASARKSFRKLLKDSKNKNFRDKIYYEMGIFEIKQHNLKEGIANYNRAIREGSNRQVDGEAYLRLGEIYYDTLKNFPLSQAYYDSAVSSLPNTYTNYKAIQARQKILNEFVKNLNTIAWQDSLLVMAKMDTAALRKHIASVLESQKKPEVKIKKKKNRVSMNAVNSSINNTNTSDFALSDWYFGNSAAISLGQTEFARTWGTFPLADNWRRSSRTSGTDLRSQTEQSGNGVTVQPTAAVAEVVKDPVQVEFDRIFKELPLTDKAVTEANTKIQNAYFGLGDIYYFDLKETANAAKSYETLLSRYPLTEHRPETLYKLYLIFKDSDPAKAEKFAAELKQKYPDSSFAKILINPNYLKESGLVAEQQKLMYKKAYAHFETRDYANATSLVTEALALGETDFNPNLKLLAILIAGETENISQYQLALEQFIKEYAGTDLAKYAQRLLDTSRSFTLKREKERGIQYIASFNEPHFFVLISEKKDALEGTAAKALEQFNATTVKDSKLKVSNLILNDTYTLTLVSDLTGLAAAKEYYKVFTEKRDALSGLKNYKFSYFVITKDNFDIFYRTKGIDEYTRFFEKNYTPQNP